MNAPKVLEKCPTRYYAKKWIEAGNLRSDDPRAATYKKRKIDDGDEDEIFLDDDDDDDYDDYNEFGFNQREKKFLSGSEVITNN